MRISEFGQEIEIFAKVWRSISERGEDKNALPVAEGAVGGDDGVEVDLLDARGIDLIRLMVIEQNRCLKVLIPRDIFVCAHIDRWFCGSEAIETSSVSAQLRFGLPCVRTLTSLLSRQICLSIITQLAP